jgi:sulfate/thiosulfate transport system permease protein
VAGLTSSRPPSETLQPPDSPRGAAPTRHPTRADRGRITLPSIKWAVVYGVVLSLARSLGEFGAVKVVSGNIVGRTQTATLVVEQKYQNFEQPTAYSLAFLLAFASVVCIVVVSFLRPKEES